MHSTNSAEGPYVLDASVVINLLALEVQLAQQVLRARGVRCVVPSRVMDREVLEDPRDRMRPARPKLDVLQGEGVIEVAVLGELSAGRFVDLAFEVGDGEAATIALAEELEGTAVLDDGPARKVDGLSHVPLAWSVDLLLHESVVAALEPATLAAATFDALRFGRMRVPEAAWGKVIRLIGVERARLCPSLPRRALAAFTVI